MKQLFYSLLVITSFASCQKDGADNPDPSAQEPDKTGNYLITELNTNYGKFKLSYNDQKQITKAEYWYTDGYTPDYKMSQSIEYKYENGKATGYSSRMWNSTNNSLDPATTGNFVFDSQGRLTKVEKHTGKTVLWEFDAQGRPTKSIGEPLPNLIYPWTYNADGNIDFPHITSDFPGYPYLRWTEYKYTNYRNPWIKNGNGLLLYLVYGFLVGTPMELLAANLPARGEVLGYNYGNPIPAGATKITGGKSIVVHTYAWNENGTLKSHNEKTTYEDYVDKVITDTKNYNYTYDIISVKN